MVASYLYQGISFIGAGKYQQAIDDFTAAIGLNPQSAQIFLQRAQAYHKMGDYGRAMNDMKTAAKLGSKEAQDFLKPLGVPWE
jgi:tetratricopeptide (TPR) repeat protein